MDINFVKGYLLFQEKINILFDKLKKPLRLGVACSGGPDSMLLFHYIVLYKKNYNFKIDYLLVIHIIDGHQLVEKFLTETMLSAYNLIVNECDALKIERVIYNNTDISKYYEKISIETLCHKIRKDFFNKAKCDFNLDYILTGHNLDDQLEHFFIGLIRFSSLKRISGMEENNNFFVRPLLFLSKNNIKKILDDNNKKYVLDPCNNNKNYLRNKLRLNFLPILNNIDDRFEASILHFMKILSQADNIIEKLVLNEFEKNLFFNVSYFLSLDSLIQSKIIEKLIYRLGYKKEVSLRICLEIIRFLNNKSGGTHIVNNIIIKKKKNNWLINL
jgi:tRNA(Ile)-lysidine synthase